MTIEEQNSLKSPQYLKSFVIQARFVRRQINI